jgi:hypothetical protein
VLCSWMGKKRLLHLDPARAISHLRYAAER